jgi:hypothetical protein
VGLLYAFPRTAPLVDGAAVIEFRLMPPSNASYGEYKGQVEFRFVN